MWQGSTSLSVVYFNYDEELRGGLGGGRRVDIRRLCIVRRFVSNIIDWCSVSLGHYGGNNGIVRKSDNKAKKHRSTTKIGVSLYYLVIVGKDGAVHEVDI